MEEKNSCLDVEFIKAYLQSSIELETQKRIAEQTFNELLREENQWKQKMSYVAKKRYTKFSIWDMLFMACKGFGISLAILYVIITIIEFADFNSILFEDILYFIWFIILAMLVVVIPIYRKITDYIDMLFGEGSYYFMCVMGMLFTVGMAALVGVKIYMENKLSYFTFHWPIQITVSVMLSFVAVNIFVTCLVCKKNII